ncbi:MAG: HAMP domain-containing protein [Actinobacteria bacterium]|nr:HAMP domain-containing protein [Actinomycetota bacterium]
MNFKTRLTIASSLAVAIAIVAASGLIYLVVRAQLRAQVDRSLMRAADDVVLEERGFTPYRMRLETEPGGPTLWAQGVFRTGRILHPVEDGPMLPVTRDALRAAEEGSGPMLRDMRVDGTHLRVLTAPYAEGISVQIARSLEEVDLTLHRLALLLAIIAAGGVVVATGLGRAVAGAVLAPVRRLTDTAERVTVTRDTSERIEVDGEDELARLGQSFNSMLGALDEALRKQRQLVADTSHELRTPLTTIRTNAEVLEKAEDLSPEQRARLIRGIIEESEALSVLVNDLLELAREDEAELRLQEVRLDELAAQVADRLPPSASFVTDLSPTTVTGDPEKLERAIRNLIDNALKWNDPDLPIEIVVRDGTLSVRDHGPGVEEDDLAHAFDRFYRAAGARGLPGSGLGLAIVKQIVEAHGGSVRLENVPEGGAVATVDLPTS